MFPTRRKSAVHGHAHRGPGICCLTGMTTKPWRCRYRRLRSLYSALCLNNQITRNSHRDCIVDNVRSPLLLLKINSISHSIMLGASRVVWFCSSRCELNSQRDKLTGGVSADTCSPCPYFCSYQWPEVGIPRHDFMNAMSVRYAGSGHGPVCIQARIRPTVLQNASDHACRRHTTSQTSTHLRTRPVHKL